MKRKLFSGNLVLVLVTAGLTLTTNAKPQAHGHQHGDVFDRIMQNSKASSGSSLNITALGAESSETFYITRSGLAY